MLVLICLHILSKPPIRIQEFRTDLEHSTINMSRFCC